MQQRRETRRRVRCASEATFESVAKSWIEAPKAHWSAGYLYKIERRLAKNAYPWLGSRPVNEISTPDYIEVIHYAQDRGVSDTARRVRETCNCVFRYAVENGLIKSSEQAALRVAPHGIFAGQFAHCPM
jgi:hypothetical protein